MNKSNQITTFKSYVLLTGYIIFTLIIFLFLTLSPANSSYIYAKFNHDMDFGQITKILSESDIRLIDEGAFTNSYILYLPSPKAKTKLQEYTSFLVNPIFARGCSSKKGYILP